MGINFPNAPTIGQLYPSPATPGLPVYQWDGEKWTTGPPNIPDGLVHYDIAQSLTTPQILQARSNIYAAPFDAMSYSGMQVNGGCEVSQEKGNTNFAVTVSTMTYIQDSWKFYYTSAPLAMVAYPAATSAAATTGIPNCLLIQSTAGKASLAAADQIFIDHPIEGYRMARLAWGTSLAQPLTIGFWVLSSAMAGTMGVMVYNGTNANRSYTSNVVINNANTWEYKTLTIPGDTAGTWASGNALSLAIRFCFGAGSSNIQAPNTWLTTVGSGTSTTTNFHSAPNYNGITGFVVLPGTQGPTAAQSPLVMRPYDQELLTCSRYLWRWTGGYGARLCITFNDQTTTTQGAIFTPVPMRIVPTVTQSNMTVGGAALTSIGMPAGYALAPTNEHSIVFAVSSGLVVGSVQQVYAGTGNGWVQLDARL